MHIFQTMIQVILLIITDAKKWHYLDVKKLFPLFWKLKSRHDGNFYCLNCLHSFIQKIKSKSTKMYVKIMMIAI